MPVNLVPRVSLQECRRETLGMRLGARKDRFFFGGGGGLFKILCQYKQTTLRY